MSRRQVKLLLAVYFMIFFGAVFARVDYFPLSWVPMYGLRETDPLLTVPVGDLRQRERGFKVTRANGDVDYVSRLDLNLPPANFRRLYYERAFGKAPPQHLRERKELHSINRLWYERLVGPDPLQVTKYPQQVLDSINRTFGLAPGDPRYIVRMEARSIFARYPRADRDRGDLSRPILEEWISLTDHQSTNIIRRPRSAS